MLPQQPNRRCVQLKSKPVLVGHFTSGLLSVVDWNVIADSTRCPLGTGRSTEAGVPELARPTKDAVSRVSEAPLVERGLLGFWAHAVVSSPIVRVQMQPLAAGNSNGMALSPLHTGDF